MQSNSSFSLRQACWRTLMLLALGTAYSAQAEEVLPEYTFMDAVKTGKNLSSLRLRYEHVEQDGNSPAGAPLKDANAVTLRTLLAGRPRPSTTSALARN